MIMSLRPGVARNKSENVCGRLGQLSPDQRESLSKCEVLSLRCPAAQRLSDSYLSGLCRPGTPLTGCLVAAPCAPSGSLCPSPAALFPASPPCMVLVSIDIWLDQRVTEP